MPMIRVAVKGGGDLGTGAVLRLRRAGFRVWVTELPRPLAIRRAVAVASAVYEGVVTIEGHTARRVEDPSAFPAVWARGEIPVLVDPEGESIRSLRPEVVVDAIMAKRNTGTALTDAPVVVALGPGFVAGVDCYAVVETARGHDLGRVYYTGSALPDTGIPGTLGGHDVLRVLRAPCAGLFRGVRRIGDRVEAGEVVAFVGETPVRTAIAGVLRGLLADGLEVTPGMKVGDVDPRAEVRHCFTVSDKAWAVGGGVLEAVLRGLHEKGLLRFTDCGGIAPQPAEVKNVWVRVAALDEVPVGSVKVFVAEGRRVALARVGDQVFAFGDVCTHDGGPLGEGKLEGFAVQCPRHGARFDIRTGRVLRLPAVVPIPVYPVRVEDDGIWVDVAG